MDTLTNGYSAKHRSDWQPLARVNSGRIDSAIRAWVVDRASLTFRLQHSCAQAFRVEVLNQAWHSPRWAEARLFNQSVSQIAYVRHVFLYCGEIPVIFARTVIPKSSVTGKLRMLTRLGVRPLGAVLFATKSMRKMGVEIAAFQPNQLIYNETMPPDPAKQPLWARRTLFSIHGKPLLVSEVFLPTIKTVRFNRFPYRPQ